MTAHSILAPSSAFRWIECNAAAQWAAMYPEPETEASREGTAAHWLGALMLEGKQGEYVDATTAPNGVIITDEMREGAELWANHVWGALHGTGAHPLVELRVAIRRIHAECFGTPDTWAWLADRGVLHVWDYKFGHDPVEVVDNWQLILYVCGILDQLGIDGTADQHVTVHMHVIQPRNFRSSGPINTWTVTASDLRAYFNTAHAAAAGAMGPSPTTKAGTHCLYCPARHSCPTLQRAVLSALTYAGDTSPDDLTPEAAGRELELLRYAETLVRARLTGREADVESRIGRGQQVPGWVVEHTVGRQRFTVPAERIAILGDLSGVDLRKPLDVRTPAQALELFKKSGVDGSVIQPYIERPRGAAKLVPDTGLNEMARRAFGDSNG